MLVILLGAKLHRSRHNNVYLGCSSVSAVPDEPVYQHLPSGSSQSHSCTSVVTSYDGDCAIQIIDYYVS